MSMMHTLAPTPHTLQDRFFAALEQVQDKLLHLLANSPLLLVAILIVLGAIWLGGVISRRMHVLNRISRNNPYMDGLLRNAVKAVSYTHLDVYKRQGQQPTLGLVARLFNHLRPGGALGHPF